MFIAILDTHTAHQYKNMVVYYVDDNQMRSFCQVLVIKSASLTVPDNDATASSKLYEVLSKMDIKQLHPLHIYFIVTIMM